jgi:hypothetical protein
MSFLFYNTYAVSYQECVDNGLLNNAISADSSLDIIGARGAQCNISCAQRFFYEFICYSDVGVYYDIWFWGSCFAYFSVLLWSIYCLYMILRIDAFKIKIGPQLMTICGVIFTGLIRLIWLAGMYNGRTPDVFDGFVIFDVILAKSIQTLQLVLFMGIVLVWKNIVDSTKHLKQIDKNQNSNILKYIAIIYTVVAVLLLPISVIANLYIPRLNMIVGAVIGIYVLLLIIASIKYSFGIRNILKNSSDSKKLNLIRSIQKTNLIFSCVGFIYIIVIICIYMRLLVDPVYKVFLNWGIISICENINLVLFSSSVSFKARNTSHKSSPGKNYSTTTVMSTTK